MIGIMSIPDRVYRLHEKGKRDRRKGGDYSEERRRRRDRVSKGRIFREVLEETRRV